MDHATSWTVDVNTDTVTLEGFWRNSVWCPIIRGAQDDDPGDTGDGTGDDAPDETGDDAPDDDADKPTKSFSQEDVNRLTARAAEKAKRGKVDPKELGFESKAQLEQFLQAQKEKEDEAKSEADKALEEAKKAAEDEAKSTYLSKAKQLTLKAEFKVQAQEAGVPRDRIEDAFALAQTLEEWGEVEVSDDGEVDGLGEDFFNELKEKKPYLFSDEEGDEDQDAGGAGAGAHGKKGRVDRKAKLKEQYSALRMAGQR